MAYVVGRSGPCHSSSSSAHASRGGATAAGGAAPGAAPAGEKRGPARARARGRAADIPGALPAAAAALDGGGRAAPSPKTAPVRLPGGILPARQYAPACERQARTGHHPQTATCAGSVSDCVTITLPVHPLRGVRLPVVRTIRNQDGRRYIDVEYPRGWSLRLPIEWTDRSSPWVPPTVEGHEVRLSVSALLKLAGAVEVALGQEQAPPTPSGPAAEPRFIHASSSLPESRTAVARTVRGARAGPPRRVGEPAALRAEPANAEEVDE
jgi:hypothetical protein